MMHTDEILESRILFGDQVKKFREEQRLTQEQLGYMVGLDRSYVSRIECGRCNVTLSTILILANGFGVSPSELLTGIGLPELDAREQFSPHTKKARYYSTRL